MNFAIKGRVAPKEPKRVIIKVKISEVTAKSVITFFGVYCLKGTIWTTPELVQKLQIHIKKPIIIMGSKKNRKKDQHTRKGKTVTSKRKKNLAILSIIGLAAIFGFTAVYITDMQKEDHSMINATENQEPKELTQEEKDAIFEKLRKENPDFLTEFRCEPGTKKVDGQCEPIMIKTP